MVQPENGLWFMMKDLKLTTITPVTLLLVNMSKIQESTIAIVVILYWDGGTIIKLAREGVI